MQFIIFVSAIGIRWFLAEERAQLLSFLLHSINFNGTHSQSTSKQHTYNDAICSHFVAKQTGMQFDEPLKLHFTRQNTEFHRAIYWFFFSFLLFFFSSYFVRFGFYFLQDLQLQNTRSKWRLHSVELLYCVCVSVFFLLLFRWRTCNIMNTYHRLSLIRSKYLIIINERKWK